MLHVAHCAHGCPAGWLEHARDRPTRPSAKVAQRGAAQRLAEAPVLPLQDVWAPDALQRFSVSFLYARIMLVGRYARVRPP